MARQFRSRRTMLGLDDSGTVTNIEFAVCEYCQIEVLVEDLETHLRNCVHSPQKQAYLNAARERLLSKQRCEKKRTKFSSSPDIEELVAQVPKKRKQTGGKKVQGPGKSINAQQSQNRRARSEEFVKCYLCGGEVKAKNLKKHRSKRCPVGKKLARQKHQSKSNNELISKERDGRNVHMGRNRQSGTLLVDDRSLANTAKIRNKGFSSQTQKTIRKDVVERRRSIRGKEKAVKSRSRPKVEKTPELKQGPKSKIRLEETETQYLVAIPPGQRERAKRIKPRYWHVGLKRWVYPRNSQIYHALVDEFGDDADFVDITCP